MTFKKRLAAMLLAGTMAVSAVPASAVIAGAETLETAEVGVDYLASGKTVEILGEKYETDTTSLSVYSYEKNLTKTDRKNIGKLKFLEELTISGSNLVLKDLSFLKSCTKLKTLKLSSCTVKDFSALKELSSLTELRLISMTLTKNDVKQIGKIKNLKSLYVDCCTAESYSDLKNLTKLESLTFRMGAEFSNKNLSKHLSFINKLKNLKTLTLYVGFAKGLPSLGNLTKLEELTISCGGYGINGVISNVPGLDKLKNLRMLNLNSISGFRVSDLSALAGMKNLEELKFFDVGDIDVDTLSKLPSLKKLGYFKVGDAKSQEEAEVVLKEIQKSLPDCDIHMSGS